MLIYTASLEEYIIYKILPQLLLDPSHFKIIGSFGKKYPYITSIQVINQANLSNIRQRLLDLIQGHLSEHIILMSVTCGRDPRFKLRSMSDTNELKSLLNSKELDTINWIESLKTISPEQKLKLINKIIRHKYKLRWTPEKISQNEMKLSGNKSITFDSVLQNNKYLVLQYFVYIKSIPIGFDVITVYESEIPEILEISENKIEKKFGLYKQLIIRINTYNLFFVSKKLNMCTAKNIIISILRDIQIGLPDIKNSNILIKIRNVAENSDPKYKLHQWNILLGFLQDELVTACQFAIDKEILNSD